MKVQIFGMNIEILRPNLVSLKKTLFKETQAIPRPVQPLCQTERLDN